VRLERGSFQSQLSFAPLGDLTGDGIDDFAIGFPEAPMTAAEPRAGAGEILFIQGRSSWPQSIDLSSPSSYFSRIHGVGDNHSLAHELVNVGDVNGDGLPDLLSNSVPNFSNARSYLIYTKRSMPGEMDIESYVQGGGGVILDRLNRTAALTAFIDLAPAGDVNLDGFQDFLLGDETGGDLNRGTVFLVKGGPQLPGTLSLTDPPEDPGIVLVLGAAQHVQAGTVGPAGDFNGDGLSAFLVGSQSPTPPDPGQVWIIFGEKEPPARLELRRLGGHGLLLTGGQQTARVEISASQAGDLNGDGHPDFAFSETGSPGAV